MRKAMVLRKAAEIQQFLKQTQRTGHMTEAYSVGGEIIESLRGSYGPRDAYPR